MAKHRIVQTPPGTFLWPNSAKMSDIVLRSPWTMFSLLISIFLFKKDKRIPKRLNREIKGGKLLIGLNPDRHKNVTFCSLWIFPAPFSFFFLLFHFSFPLLSPLFPAPQPLLSSSRLPYFYSSPSSRHLVPPSWFLHSHTDLIVMSFVVLDQDTYQSKSSHCKCMHG